MEFNEATKELIGIFNQSAQMQDSREEARPPPMRDGLFPG